MPTPDPLPAGVYLIGAGPGDPELLTVKAHKILARADTVIFAHSLVPSAILQAVRADAERVPTGNKTLEQILPIAIDRVRSGHVVVRLHSGDLSLYSAIHEQIRALTEAEVPFELVPGIGAYQDATAKLGIELTVPELTQTIILTRISGRASAVPEAEALASLAAHGASLGLYLAARHVAAAQAQLQQHYPEQTPVAICYRLGWPDEAIWLVPLAQMAAQSQQQNLTRTTLYLIGPAVEAARDRAAYNLAQARSRLYHPDYAHLFRPARSAPTADG